MRCTCTACPVCNAAKMVCAECGQCTRCSNHVPNCEGCPGRYEVTVLEENGWKEVPSDVSGKTCWLAPTKLSQTPLYFSLEAAYELETTGEGVWAYAGKVALSEALYDEDVRRMMEQEANGNF